VLFALLLLPACDLLSGPVSSPFLGDAHALPVLSAEQKARLLDAADRAIADHVQGRKDFVPLADFEGVNNRVYVILWQRGRKLYAWWTAGDNLSDSVYRATRKALEKGGQLGTEGLSVHIQVMGRDRPLADGGYVHGLHGLSFRRSVAVNHHASYAIETNYNPDNLQRRLRERLDARDPGKEEMERYYFTVHHFARGYGEETIADYYMGSTPVFEVDFSEEDFADTHRRAQDWLVSAVSPEGQFHYLYYPSRNHYSTSRNNMIRQLMSSRGLAELASEREELLPLHRRNLDYIFEHWYREERDHGFIYFRDKSKLGANATALRALVYSPLFDDYREQALRLAKSIMYLQLDDGSFEPWYKEPGYNYDRDRLLTFYSGEALLALLEYYNRTGDEMVLAAAMHSQDYYVRRYADELEKNYYPAYVPWHAQSLSALYKISGERRYAEAVFTMTDKLLEIQNRDGADDSYYLGRFYNPATPQYGSPHSSSDAVYTEGVAYAYELALELGDKARARRYREALILGLHNLRNLQYRDERMYFVRELPAVDGAMRIHTTNNAVRVDTTQHALDAFSKVAELLEKGIPVFSETQG
jgi:hypothetical protein